MPVAKRFCVIAYDIADDRQRARLEKLVSGIATRVQDSVFEGWLRDVEVRRFLQRANPLLTRPGDSLRVYPLCTRCRKQIDWLGRGGSSVEPQEWIV